MLKGGSTACLLNVIRILMACMAVKSIVKVLILMVPSNRIESSRNCVQLILQYFLLSSNITAILPLGRSCIFIVMTMALLL